METKPKKYIAMFDNNLPIPFDNVETFAQKLFGFRVEERDNGFDVIEFDKVVARYGMSFETIENVKKDYLSCFLAKHTYKNLHFYTLFG